MTIYIVYIKNTDSIFFKGEAFNKAEAIEDAKDAYIEKYPEEEDNIDSIEWSTVELDDE